MDTRVGQKLVKASCENQLGIWNLQWKYILFLVNCGVYILYIGIIYNYVY